MTKKVTSLLVALISIAALASCGSSNKSDASTEDSAAKTVTLTDMVGDTITIDKNPKKVACVSRTTYDLLVAFGLGDKVDGAYTTIYDNPWTEYMYPSSKDEYRYAYEESYETFFARGVDLVFAPEKYIADGLKEHGVNAVCVSLYGNPTFDNYVHFFSNLVTEIWDDPAVKAKVEAWDKKVDKAIADVTTELAKHDIQKKKIFYVRGDKNKGIGYTDTAASFTEYAFRSLGFDFAGSTMSTNKPQAEDIVAYNPDAFVIGGIYQNKLVETLTTTEPYTTLDAVKNGKYYTIPVGLTMFEQISAMTPIFFYDMANKIYPEYFSYDVSTMIKDAVKDYFGTDLTDEDVKNIQSGKNNLGEDLA